MRPSRPKEDRLFDQVERGLAADRLITDDEVLNWFASEEARLTENMLQADVMADEARRAAALEINMLRRLKNHLEVTATMGRSAAKEQEKVKRNG